MFEYWKKRERANPGVLQSLKIHGSVLLSYFNPYHLYTFWKKRRFYLIFKSLRMCQANSCDCALEIYYQIKKDALWIKDHSILYDCLIEIGLSRVKKIN